MFRNLPPWHKKICYFVIYFSSFSGVNENCFAQNKNDVSYFNGKDIDYWSEGKSVSSQLPKKTKLIPENAEFSQPHFSIRQRDSLPFDWNNYQNPSSPEFWDDGGDYIAPRPLREAVSNPTAENLDKYAAWQAKRIVLIAEFDQKLSARRGIEQAEKSKNKKGAKKKIAHLNLREIQLMYFYQSSCTHCRAEKNHVESLARQGIQVTYIQLDSDTLPPLHKNSVPYSKTLSKQFQISATPTWVFRRREKTAQLQGAQSDEAIQSEILKLFSVPEM